MDIFASQFFIFFGLIILQQRRRRSRSTRWQRNHELSSQELQEEGSIYSSRSRSRQILIGRFSALLPILLEIFLPQNEVLFQSFYASVMPLRCYYSFPMQDPNIVRAIHHTQCITVLILILWYFFILEFSILSISFRKREPIEPIHICRL